MTLYALDDVNLDAYVVDYPVAYVVIEDPYDPSQNYSESFFYADASIAAGLGVATYDLRIEKTNRFPQLVVAGEAAPVALSLSHHGSYVGFAVRPDAQRSGLH